RRITDMPRPWATPALGGWSHRSASRASASFALETLVALEKVVEGCFPRSEWRQPGRFPTHAGQRSVERSVRPTTVLGGRDGIHSHAPTHNGLRELEAAAHAGVDYVKQSPSSRPNKAAYG